MEDLFDREQRIYDKAMKHLVEIQNGIPCSGREFETLVKEYGKLLRQTRRITRISDRTTVDLNESKQELLGKVHYDSLTGIYNRRYLEENLERVIKSISRSGGMLSVLMADIDYFKKYNDTYGHRKGDECLKLIARALNSNISRDDDFIARYGGEEFAAVLPHTDEKGACAIAVRMIESIRACNIAHEKNEVADCVTVSIGVTTGNVDYMQRNGDYIRRADEALYMSKQNGRNRYTFIQF